MNIIKHFCAENKEIASGEEEEERHRMIASDHFGKLSAKKVEEKFVAKFTSFT